MTRALIGQPMSNPAGLLRCFRHWTLISRRRTTIISSGSARASRRLLSTQGDSVPWREQRILRRTSRLEVRLGFQNLPRSRNMATVESQTATPATDSKGPMAEYDARVDAGKLRDDSHQRTIIKALQDLHDTLAKYKQPEVVQPTIESLKPAPRGLFGTFFGAEAKPLEMSPPAGLPKGLYMYGDVGSGKTMLMDLFYETLPANITSKKRIHFHNFMQDVHKELHKMKMRHGNDVDAVPFVAAEFAQDASVLCFDEFQCTDVADAMILRRLMESLMAHGVVLVTTSNRHPRELYKNGIQRDSFIPCINLLIDQLRVINLDSPTDYRKIPRPESGVYHNPLNEEAKDHAEHWFKFLGDPAHDPSHSAKHTVWGREIIVPRASGRACWFTFAELLGKATGAADYLELMRRYDSFIVTDVPGMNLRSRDVARRFITFLDAAYEARAVLVLTSAVPVPQLFMSRDEIGEMLSQSGAQTEGSGVNDAMRSLMDDLGMSMDMMKQSSIFTGDEEAFAFARALSRLNEMGSQEWVERKLDGANEGVKREAESWRKTRSSYHQDSY